MNKYNQLIEFIALEMATQKFMENFNEIAKGSPFMPRIKFNPDDPLTKKHISSFASTCISVAKIAVWHMAEAYETGWYEAVGKNDYEKEIVARNMKEHGLIPA